MEYNHWSNEAQRIVVLRKIILLYLEQYMLYHMEMELNSYMSLKKLIEEQNLRCLFRVLSKGLLLNIEQFIKNRKWMSQENVNSIKNITITSINIIPEDHDKQSSIGSEQELNDSKQVSCDSLNIFETIIIPDEPKLGEDNEIKEESSILRKTDSDLIYGDIEYKPGLILGKLSFISLSLKSISKMLEIAKIPATSVPI